MNVLTMLINVVVLLFPQGDCCSALECSDKCGVAGLRMRPLNFSWDRADSRNQQRACNEQLTEIILSA
jgi:hypothetical protein